MKRKTSDRFRWVKRAALVGALLATAVVCAIWLVPLPAELQRPVEGTTRLVDRHGRLLAALPHGEARDCTPLPLAQMGAHLPAVTVALEDHRFHTHHGCDVRATAAAFWRNVRAGRVISGGSTVTQQLIKLASHRTRRSWRAKIYENLAAAQLEWRWNKDQILEAYLNRSHYEIGRAHV